MLRLDLELLRVLCGHVVELEIDVLQDRKERRYFREERHCFTHKKVCLSLWSHLLNCIEVTRGAVLSGGKAAVLATKAVGTQCKGSVFAAKAVETHKAKAVPYPRPGPDFPVPPRRPQRLHVLLDHEPLHLLALGLPAGEPNPGG